MFGNELQTGKYGVCLLKVSCKPLHDCRNNGIMRIKEGEENKIQFLNQANTDIVVNWL